MTLHQRLNHLIKLRKKWPGLAILIAALLLSSPYGWSAKLTSKNQLSQAFSPYLTHHADDPVYWQSWQPQVLAEAKRQQKLILLSSGYFSCHWCHVMQRETYQDPSTAKFLNTHFISVKIDRELLPDTDQTMIDFARKSAGRAGWPQHVILTPEGLPLYAFVYLPKTQMINRLERLLALWQSNPEQLRQIAKEAIPSPTPLSEKPLTVNQTQFINAFNQQLQQQLDDFSGGLKSSQKFPEPHLLLTTIQQPSLKEPLQAWLKLTLDQMQSQGLYDAIHGGFFRYTIDPNWQTPHFEKMLYSQALLAKLYFLAFKRFGDKQYLQTARKTLQYAEQYLWNPTVQLFMSSHSAIDFKQQEGGAYLWSLPALKQRLNATEFAFLKDAWQLSEPPPFELGWLPKRTDRHWSDIQAKLKQQPGSFPIDDKSIISWNALMLSSYATAFQFDSTRRPHYQKTAQALLKGLKDVFDLTPIPRALNRNGHSMGLANLEDFALTYQALDDWHAIYQSSLADQNLLSSLRKWQAQLFKQAKAQFLTDQGWQLSPTPILPGQRTYWAVKDGDTPSATAQLDCEHPKHLAQIQTDLLANPLGYASYARTLQCMQEAQH